MANILRAGVAVVDVSPKPGVPLDGYPHHPRYNKGVHDSLYAACLLLDDGKTQLAIVTMDILMISKRYVSEVRKSASATTGIPASNIMICCSHTHSSPRASAMFTMDAAERGQGPNAEFVAETVATLVSLIERAATDMFEATIGVEKGFCGREQGVGGNRHDPKGVADPEVWTIGVRDLDGRWRGIFVKYALHPTFLHSDNFLVSADYPGYIRSYLSDSIPGAVFLFAQGTSGNQSPRYFRSGKTFEEAERVGTTIGVEVERVLSEMEVSNEAGLLVTSEEVEIEMRDLPDKAIAVEKTEEARQKWDEMKASGADERDIWNAELIFLGAEDTLSLVMLQEMGNMDIVNDEWPVEIQVIGIGDLRIVACQGELFVEFGLAIQYRAPFTKCFAIELANGVLPGYAATSRAYAEGGYEVGASMLTGRSGDQLVDAAVELLYSTR